MKPVMKLSTTAASTPFRRNFTPLDQNLDSLPDLTQVFHDANRPARWTRLQWTRYIAQERKGVLTAPVSALLALAEAGTSSKLVGNGSSRVEALVRWPAWYRRLTSFHWRNEGV
jgi:hypothetical protein